jgi:hypothetical protein
MVTCRPVPVASSRGDPGRALSPTDALRVATRTGPGCQTASEGRTVPVAFRPSTSCQRSTAALVAQVKWSSTVMARSGS